MTDDAAYRRWLDDVLRRYRQLGFFAHGEYAGLAGAALREAVLGDHDRWFRDGYLAACRRPLALSVLERLVVTRDHRRIWQTDPEQVHQRMGMLNFRILRIVADPFRPLQPWFGMIRRIVKRLLRRTLSPRSAPPPR